MVLISLILFFLVVFNSILKKSKPLFILTLIFMWLLATFTYGNADEMVYQSRYEDTINWENNTEYLFLLLIKICHFFNLTFIEYKGVVFFVLLVLIASTIWKLSNYPNIVLTLYMFYPFLMHISQIRNALATAVFIFGCRYLVNNNSVRISYHKFNLSINDIKYILCIVIASLLHTAAIIWIVLLIAKKVNLKSNVVIAIIVNIFVYFSSAFPILENKMASLLGATDRMDAYFSSNYQISNFRHYGTVIPVLLTLIIFIITYTILWKTNHDKTALLGIKLNIIMSICISLILKYSSEFYRPVEGLLIINYILSINLIPKVQLLKVKTRIPYFVSEISIVVAVSLFLFFIVKGNVATVLSPVFYNNYLFNLFNG